MRSLMMRLSISAVTGSFLCLLCVASTASQVVRKTALGNVNGVLCSAESVTGQAKFLGIPYAEPPIGRLRWRAPSPYKAIYPAGGLDASMPGSPCRQGNEGDEDCLYLNVFAPANISDQRTKLPVRVFIHGGGFQTGQGAEDMYNGCKLAADGNVVFVTLNYRLGVLGFLALPELRDVDADRTVGNWGLLDQQRALQWVRDNIASFGGDPRRVAISGESAGAYSTLMHMVMPGSRGLFASAASFSGSADAMAVDFLKDAYRKGEGIREALNCTCAAGKTRGFATTSACLRAARADVILAVQAELCPNTVDLALPTIDGVTLPKHPVLLMREGRINKVPVLLGVNANEGALEVIAQTRDAQNIDVYGFFFVVNNLIRVAPSFYTRLYEQYNAGLNFAGNWLIAAFNAITDGGYHCPSRRAARAFSQFGVPTRYHILQASTPNSGCVLLSQLGVPLSQEIVDLLGALHGYDIPFTFLAPYREPYNSCPYTANETQLASFLSGIINSMAASSQPLPPRTASLTAPLLNRVASWPTWSVATDAATNSRVWRAPVMIIDTANPAVYDAADIGLDKKCQLWDDILAADIAAGTTIHS